MNAKRTQKLTDSQEMDCLNQLFQEQLLVNQVPCSVWGVLLSLSPDDYKTEFLERTKPARPHSGHGTNLSAALPSSPSRSTTSFGYYIGRHKSCDIRIQNPHISNRHCLIYRVESEYLGSSQGGSRVYLEDTSTNGTYVNGKRVGKNASIELCDGDEIQLVRYQESKGMDYFNDRFYVFQNLEIHRQEPCLFKQSYLLADHLGKGAFAQVRVAINRVTGERFAAKIIDRNRITQLEKRKKMDENFQIETSILSRVRHPAIVQVHGVFREHDYLYLVLDLASDGELFDEIVRREFLSEDDARRVLLQLLLAIRHLNRLGIVHRDIKLENILLEDKKSLRIKLADFGLAKIVGEHMFMKTVCGTPMYVAPEVLTVRQQGMYDNLVDVWSLGVVLYICLCGFPPFSDELSPPPMRDQIIGGMYSFPSPYWDDISPDAIDLVCRMLQVAPKDRITVDDALAHPWLKARCNGHSWTIDGTCFSVIDPDALEDSQNTQSLTAGSSHLISQPNSTRPPSMLAMRSPVSAQAHPALPPSSPPTNAALRQDSEVVVAAVYSASDGETHAPDQHNYASAPTGSIKGVQSAGNARINAPDGAKFGASGGSSRKRKDPSFMRSQSDLGNMLSPKRKVGFDLCNNYSPQCQQQPEQFAMALQASLHSSASPAAMQASNSGQVELFEMSPDMSRRPSCNIGGSDSSSSEFCGAQAKPSTHYAFPLSIYPEPIPRPGTHIAAGLNAGLTSKTTALGTNQPKGNNQRRHSPNFALN